MIDSLSYVLLRHIRGTGGCRFTTLLSTVKNPATLSKRLKSLIALGVVVNENSLYRVSEKGVEAMKALDTLASILKEKIIVTAERVPHRFFSTLLERYCYLLYDEYRNRLVGVVVFGSVARGVWDRDSDIDLLVVIENWNRPTWERSRQLLLVRQRLRETLEYTTCVKGGYVPVIQHYPLDLEEAKTSHRLYLDLCLDGIILYDKNQFMTNLMTSFRERIGKLGARRVTVPGKGFYWQFREARAGETFPIC